jgi:hypothetical protein
MAEFRVVGTLCVTKEWTESVDSVVEAESEGKATQLVKDRRAGGAVRCWWKTCEAYERFPSTPVTQYKVMGTIAGADDAFLTWVDEDVTANCPSSASVLVLARTLRGSAGRWERPPSVQEVKV